MASCRSRSTRLAWWFCICLASAFAGLASAAEPPAVEPAELQFQNRPIATLRASLGPVSPQARVAAAERRLAGSSPAELRRPVIVVPYGDARGVALGERILFAIVPDDVDTSTGETVDSVAHAAAERLRIAVAAWADQQRPEVVARGLGHVAVATLLAIIALVVLFRVRRFFIRRLPVGAEGAMRKRHVVVFGQNLQGAVVRGLETLVAVLSLLAAVIVLYLWLTYSLRQFPLTAPWGDGLATFLLGTAAMIGLGILRGIPDMMIVILVLFVTRLFARAVGTVFDAVESGQVTIRRVHPDTAQATRRIVTALVWIFGVAIAYPFIPGSDSDAFKGISVLVGLMISLGSTGIINQAMSGMVVVFSRALKAGEYVTVGDYEGTVTEVGALSTKIRTKRNEEINIPNSMLVSSATTNYSRLASEHGSIVYSTAGIGYNAPWRVVHQLLVDAALRTPGVKHDPAPFVRQSALTPFCVDYTILAYLENPEDRLAVRSNLNANIQDGFNEAGIQIMTPAFESQPSEPVLVPKAKWDTAGEPPR